MSEHRDDDLTAAFHRLQATVRQQVRTPASAALRAAATRQLRVRRATIGVLAAAAVATIALGSAAVLQPTAAPPVSPAGSPSPTPSPYQTAMPAPPDPQPSPQRPPEPFADVDWGEVTVDLPEHERCPSGMVDLVPVPEPYPAGYGPAERYPRVTISAEQATYGDLTGDDRAEAVLGAWCAGSDEESYDGEGQLLVVSRDPDGTLRALAWVGPRGSIYQGTWVADGDLYVEAHPSHSSSFEETLEWMPGMVLRYQWEGAGFSDYQWASEYATLSPFDGARLGPPVRLEAVALGLNCPAGTVQFGSDNTAALDGAVYDIHQPGLPSSGPHLLDLDRTGKRSLALAIHCTRGEETTGGLGIFEIGDGEFRGISVLVPPTPSQIGPWDARDGRLHVLLDEGPDAVSSESWYEWNGTEFQPAT